MRFKATALASGFVMCAALAPAAWAGTRSPSVNRIEHREQVRIHQGIRSGELTRAEAARLEAEQAKIRVNERFAKRDGELTAKERQRLHKELHHASRDIYRQKHDHQDRN